MADGGKTVKSRHLRALSFLALIAWGNADAAAPVCITPIPDQTWTGSGSKSFQFSSIAFRDTDWDDLTYTARQADGTPLPSWLSFNPTTRTFSGNPPAGTSKITLRVTANDGHNGTAVCAFGLNLVNVNDTPTVRESISDKSWRRGSAQSFQFASTTFRDRDSDRLTYTARQANGSALPSWLRFSSSTRTFSGTPPAYASTLNIQVTANDGRGGTVSDTFVIAFSNRAPVAANDSLSVTPGQAVGDTLTATDADRNSLTYRIVDNPAKGQVNLNASTGAFTYTPNSGAIGTDTFTFRANDGRVDSNLATVTVTFLRNNHDPVASIGTLTVNQNTAGTGTLQATDADAGDALLYRIVTNGTKGMATITNASTGEYRYTPNSGATGTDTFTFKANDGTVDSAEAMVAVTINVLASEVTNSLGMTFKLIPAGTFMMGASLDDIIADSGYNNATPQHQVTISRPFYMQTTEITQRQWRAVTGSNPSYFSYCGDNCPAEQIRFDIQTFITAMNARNEGTYRLPTEAEWEYAARAGTTTAWSFGSNLLDINNYIWSWNNSGSSGSRFGTHPVAQKLPNPWGLYDMHGSVWELVSDWHGGVYPSSEVIDPQGPNSGVLHVLRGGSWADYPVRTRSATRTDVGLGGHTEGARLVRVP
ncbi:MAG: SUMF1/EgtB/PvdO family nonheme iron enzyme [Magnetococcales bacterium]|nr:SUMF1/EgtB/PvdO family nonheme iron enzyme [Magnetococcales bacterium]